MDVQGRASSGRGLQEVKVGLGPPFFIPGAKSPEQAEEIYAVFSKTVLRASGAPPAPPLPTKDRIFAITFVQDGVRWTAMVGHTLRGIETVVKRRKGGPVEIRSEKSDPATVLAIFPGYPYWVCTNARSGDSMFQNPFMAGQPVEVTLFGR